MRGPGFRLDPRHSAPHLALSLGRERLPAAGRSHSAERRSARQLRVPQSLGIGLSRGAACRLATPEKTLDYSGRTLNLATRLMDFARPDGIVIDAEFGIELPPDELRGLFEAHDVYIRSVAQRTTRRIYALAGRTVISDAAKRPIDEPVWHRAVSHLADGEGNPRFGSLLRIALNHRVSDPNELVVTLLHPAVGPGRQSAPRRPRYLSASRPGQGRLQRGGR